MKHGATLNLLVGERGTQVFLAMLLALVGIAGAGAAPGCRRKARRCTCRRYTMTLIGKYMTYALLAVAVDLVWGYCGILSLGHAAFFALGGYAMGMYLMRQIGTRGVYGDPVLPDFMVFLNYKELPWFWHGFDMFWFAMLMVVGGARSAGACRSAGWHSARASPASIYPSSRRRSPMR